MAAAELRRHFKGHRVHELVTANRTFPVTARVDLQLALEKLFTNYVGTKLLGIHHPYSHHETLTFAHVLGDQHNPVVISPLQHEEVDIGELYLPGASTGDMAGEEERMPFGLLVSAADARNFGPSSWDARGDCRAAR